jgi:hypothetical protein
MALVTNVNLADGHLRPLESTLNELNSLRFRVGTRRPIVSKSEWQTITRYRP